MPGLSHIPPQQEPKAPMSKGALAACITAACLVAAPIAAKWEGYAPKVYRDPAGIPTYCFGETEMLRHDPSHIYAKTECMALLRKRMENDYAPRIAACMPEVVTNRFVFGALIDASYNAGWAGVCKSYAPIVRAGQLRAACNKLPSWYVTATKRVNGKRVGKPFLLPGLVNRRNDERKVCLQGVPQ